MSVSPGDSLARLCRHLGFDAAAEVLEHAHNQRAVITLPLSLADTREGREHAIAALQDAFEGDADVIVITDR